MYVIRCTKAGVGDFCQYDSLDLGASFRKGQYLTDDNYGTRSLNKAETFRTLLSAKERLYNFSSALNEDDEPVPEFETVPVAISLK